MRLRCRLPYTTFFVTVPSVLDWPPVRYRTGLVDYGYQGLPVNLKSLMTAIVMKTVKVRGIPAEFAYFFCGCC
jgi:hypothetical protein